LAQFLPRIGLVVRRAGPLLANLHVNALHRELQAPTDASDAGMDRRERDMPRSQLRADRSPVDGSGRSSRTTNAGTRVGFHLT